MTMMRYSGSAQDESGNALGSASVRVTNENTGGRPALYSDVAGATSKGNPFTANADGSYDFCCAAGQYRIDATLGLLTATLRNVPIGTAQSVDAADLLAGALALCRVATTANVTIATALNNGDTIDGVVLATGDRVLVWKQTATAGNGVYVVGVTPARASDFATYDAHVGARVVVTEGATYARRSFAGMVNAGGILATTAILFADVGPLPRFVLSTIVTGAAPTDGEVVDGYVFDDYMSFPAGLTGSRATAADSPAAEVVIGILKNTVQVGTITFAIAAHVGVFAMASELICVAGDELDYQFPSPADISLRRIKITLRGNP